MTSFTSLLDRPSAKWIAVFLLAALVFIALGYAGAQYGKQKVAPLARPGYPLGLKGAPDQGSVETQPAQLGRPMPLPPTPGGKVLQPLPPIPDLSSKVIKSATVSVKIKKGKFEEAFAKAMFIAESKGGYVSSSSNSATNDTASSGILTVRIPASAFNETVSEFKKLGKLQNLNVSGTDVTEEYVDLESRLRNLRAQEDILLRLMGKATSIADTIAVETRLSDVQTQIEQLTGRKNFLDNRIAFATIELNIFEQLPQPVPVIDLGLKAALLQAVKAFMLTVNGFIIALGFLGPYVILVGIGVFIYLRSKKRKAAVARP